MPVVTEMPRLRGVHYKEDAADLFENAKNNEQQSDSERCQTKHHPSRSDPLRSVRQCAKKSESGKEGPDSPAALLREREELLQGAC
jgi:hypothetical protein